MSSDKSLGQIINVGNENVISVLDLAKLVVKLTKSKSDFRFQTVGDVYGEEYIEIQQRRPNLDKLKTLIDYSPQWTLEDTVRDIINYLD